jgi:hypothetical protein
MTDVLEEIARVGIAGWIGESDDVWGMPPVLGTIGDDLYLVEIEESNRERMILELIDHCDVDDRGLRVEIVFFGDAGGFFASSMNFLEHWPRSPADVPAEVFIDNHYTATFTKADDEITISVRHALRPGGGPPKRRFRFRSTKYEEAMSDLARESRRLRDDLIAVAQQRAPEKLETLQQVFKQWPA